VEVTAKYYVGLDVHKDTIAIAYAAAGAREEPRFLGTTTHRVGSVTKALSKLGEPAAFAICHEAGPCGYGLVRELRHRGFSCVVIAPSRVARKPADRIKTDRRDALLLARLYRAGELSITPRLEGLPQPIVEIGWKAQLRLCTRFRRLRARGLHQNKTCAAIARELAGFIWDIGQQVSPACVLH
jgi:transposase